MGIGTFGSFTQARLAIYAAQTGITVTGNNISNINTEGYTRQRLNQVSLYTAGADRYYSAGDVRTGQGALVKSLSQIRSPYLDIRYRTLNAQLGYADGRLEILDEIQQILDEVGAGDESKGEGGHGVLGLELEKLGEAFKNLVDQTGHQEYDNTVRQVCKNLITLLNRYANKLEEVRENTESKLEQNIAEVNGYLTTIRSLNEEIRKNEIHGDPSLELRDERNRQIDKLSELIDINVTYSEEEIAGGLTVEKLTIRLGDANPDSQVFTDESLLIDGIYGAQIKLDKLPVENPDAAFDPTNEDTWPYLMEDPANPGTFIPTFNKDDAAMVKEENPNWTQGDNPALRYLDANGNPTDAAHAAEKPMANSAYMPYLTEDGKPTASLAEAKKVTDPNYNMTITKLKNKLGEVYVAMDKGSPAAVSGDRLVDDGKGNLVAIKDLFKVPVTRKADPDDPTTLPYLNAANEAVATAAAAVKEKIENPAWDHADPDTQYLDADGNPTDEAHAALGPKSNPAYAPYLDENGKPTADLDRAQMVNDPNKNRISVTTPDLPNPGDTTLMIYKRVLLSNGTYAYTQQMVTQEVSRDVSLDDNDLTGKIQAWREMLTEKGEFTDRETIEKVDENAGGKRGIPYYQRTLDLLANQFAKVMNEANQGFLMDPNGNYITQGTNDKGETVGVPVTVKYQDAAGADQELVLNKDTKWEDIPDEAKAAMGPAASIEEYLKQEKLDENRNPVLDKDGKPLSNGFFRGGVLFSNNPGNDDPSGITAANISISKTWDTTHLLVCDYTCPPEALEPASGASENIRHFEYLVTNQKFDFIPTDLDGYENASGVPMLNGTFFEMWNNIGTTRGEDQAKTEVDLNSSYKNLLSVDTSRDSVSSVDFNDEAMNLMMYSKSYNAACRLMTTIDSVLDKLINGTGITT
ncbi:FlgK family flagellar hook-associated protein [Oscillibacter sp.]|uniref:FlgK family flagellar hook-associated protein n=1 Tax=Oscillibacter sp. TaxID=1945593 RepID=UPI002D801E09|nr:hypothetical protein [Oscillibacter sp.]